jgi:predicted DCC family thiol-disulfide oxidoreductase YuxK
VAPHLILYDGVCGLCNRTIRFVIARDRPRPASGDHAPTHLFDFAPLDSPLGRSLVARLDPAAPADDTFYVVPDYRATPEPTLLGKSRAALYVVERLDRPWRWLSAARVVPAAILDRVYDFVARHRHAVFGRYDTCPLPEPEHRARFVDAR